MFHDFDPLQDRDAARAATPLQRDEGRTREKRPNETVPCFFR